MSKTAPMKKISVFALLVLLVACNGPKQEAKVVEEAKVDHTAHHIPAISKVFDAHGGYDNWSKLKTMYYENGNSKTLVDLQNRYTRIDSENQTVGFDGEQVWVYPASENADRQRMRYNLMFYFYAFPFVIGDPGINYENIEPVELEGKTYNAVKVTYNNGVGDSPNDSYIICSDQETNHMQWLMYTATFGGAPKDSYNLIKYEGWTEMGGVLLPTSLQWYQYANGEVGAPRGGANTFQNIRVSEEYPAMDNFKMPEGASIANMPGGN